MARARTSDASFFGTTAKHGKKNGTDKQLPSEEIRNASAGKFHG
jgi:hypothetical protein